MQSVAQRHQASTILERSRTPFANSMGEERKSERRRMRSKLALQIALNYGCVPAGSVVSEDEQNCFVNSRNKSQRDGLLTCFCTKNKCNSWENAGVERRHELMNAWEKVIHKNDGEITMRQRRRKRRQIVSGQNFH